MAEEKKVQEKKTTSGRKPVSSSTTKKTTASKTSAAKSTTKKTTSTTKKTTKKVEKPVEEVKVVEPVIVEEEPKVEETVVVKETPKALQGEYIQKRASKNAVKDFFEDFVKALTVKKVLVAICLIVIAVMTVMIFYHSYLAKKKLPPYDGVSSTLPVDINLFIVLGIACLVLVLTLVISRQITEARNEKERKAKLARDNEIKL